MDTKRTLKERFADLRAAVDEVRSGVPVTRAASKYGFKAPYVAGACDYAGVRRKIGPGKPNSLAVDRAISMMASDGITAAEASRRCDVSRSSISVRIAKGKANA